MGAFDILAHLRERGVTLTPAPNGNLKVRPSDRLTDADRAEIRANKRELLALLNDQRTAPAIPNSVLALCGLSEPEITHMVERVALARHHGYSLDDAEVIADRLLMRDRTGLDMHACLECSRLNGRRCTARPVQPLFSASTLHELVRCPAFKKSKDTQ